MASTSLFPFLWAAVKELFNRELLSTLAQVAEETERSFTSAHRAGPAGPARETSLSCPSTTLASTMKPSTLTFQRSLRSLPSALATTRRALSLSPSLRSSEAPKPVSGLIQVRAPPLPPTGPCGLADRAGSSHYSMEIL